MMATTAARLPNLSTRLISTVAIENVENDEDEFYSPIVGLPPVSSISARLGAEYFQLADSRERILTDFYSVRQSHHRRPTNTYYGIKTHAIRPPQNTYRDSNKHL